MRVLRNVFNHHLHLAFLSVHQRSPFLSISGFPLPPRATNRGTAGERERESLFFASNRAIGPASVETRVDDA